MKSNRRRPTMAAPKTQAALLIRVVAYWLVCLTGVFLARLFFSDSTGWNSQSAGEVFRDLAPSLFGSMLLLPLALLDMIRVSNRMAGPVLRLKAAMLRVASGKDVSPITFRAGDYCSELAPAFNQIVLRSIRPKKQHNDVEKTEAQPILMPPTEATLVPAGATPATSTT